MKVNGMSFNYIEVSQSHFISWIDPVSRLNEWVLGTHSVPYKLQLGIEILDLYKNIDNRKKLSPQRNYN